MSLRLLHLAETLQTASAQHCHRDSWIQLAVLKRTAAWWTTWTQGFQMVGLLITWVTQILQTASRELSLIHHSLQGVSLAMTDECQTEQRSTANTTSSYGQRLETALRAEPCSEQTTEMQLLQSFKRSCQWWIVMISVQPLPSQFTSLLIVAHQPFTMIKHDKPLSMMIDLVINYVNHDFPR